MLGMQLPLVQLQSGTGWVFLAFGQAPFAGLHISAQQVVLVVKWLPQRGGFEVQPGWDPRLTTPSP